MNGISNNNAFSTIAVFFIADKVQSLQTSISKADASGDENKNDANMHTELTAKE